MIPSESSVREEIKRLDDAFDALFVEKREAEGKRIRLKALLLPTRSIKWTREEANAR